MVKTVDPLKEPKKPKLKTSTSLSTQKTFGDPIKDDFRVFLTLLWRHLNLPDPTPLQLDIAWYLQHHEWTGEIDHLIIFAFRGAAKSWITAAYVLWLLLRDPQEKILVVSGSAKRAVAFVNFCMTLILEVPILLHLAPKPSQRQSSMAFDVGPSLPAQSASLTATGITSQTVGYRATRIVGDDLETNTNSMTPDMREKLADAVREFDAIIMPGGQIVLLGTPQTDASVYNVLEKDRGYRVKVWPVRYPNLKQQRTYGGRLADYIKWKVSKEPGLIGQSTEPTRFSEEDLAIREISWGKAGFALQYMLDTTLADVDRYPLRLTDLVVLPLDRRTGPDLVTWGASERTQLKDLHPIALDGDRLYGPAHVSETASKWEIVRAFIDPSGRGADETTLTIGAVLHSTPAILKQAGWLDGYGEETLKEIARLLVEYNVAQCRIEEDFGQGMFAQLLRPYVKDAWTEYEKRHGKTPERRGTTEIVSERAAKVQKELRILEALEPVFQSHRLIVSTEVFEDDYKVTMARDGTELRDRYSLMYQITRLTREKDCLTHDDRVEGLAGCVKCFQEEMGLSPRDQAEKDEEKRIEEQLAKFGVLVERYTGPLEALKPAMRGKLRTGQQRNRARR